MLLSIIILTKDEAANLPICLASLQSLEADVYVVDSGSKDETISIARNYGCQVYTHAFENQASQMNWALSILPIQTPWIMRLDADERITPELAHELQKKLSTTHKSICGYQVKRRVFFMGRWIKHGGYYPTWLLRIWRTGTATCEQRWMDEHIVLSHGKIANLEYDIIDENQKGISFWTEKHNRYADREVRDLLSSRSLSYKQKEKSTTDQLLKSENSSQAAQRRWVKKNLYARSPLFLRAFIYWLLRYTIGLGFLDGLQGLIFHFLQGFWYRFLVDAKLYEQKRLLKQKQSEPSITAPTSTRQLVGAKE